MITAKSEGLNPATCILKSVSAPARPVVNGFVNQEITIDEWRISQSTATKPELFSEEAGSPIQGLAPAQLGSELSLKPGAWVLYYTSFKLPESITENGGSLCFRNMTGRGSIHVNGELVHERKSSTAGDVVVHLKEGLESIEINVRMQPDSKGHILLGDIVYIIPEKLKKNAGK